MGAPEAPGFFFDRGRDRSLLADDAVNLPAPPPPTPPPDYCALLNAIIRDLKSVTSDPAYSDLSALHELTTPLKSRPWFYVQTPGSTTHQPAGNLHVVYCELRLSKTPAADHFKCTDVVRTVGYANSFENAEQDAACVAVRALRILAHELRDASAKHLELDVHNLSKLWLSKDLSARRYDAFRYAQRVITHPDHASIYAARVRPFGSHSAGLALPSSDLDMEVVLPKPDERMRTVRAFSAHPVRVLKLLERAFVNAGARQVQVIDTARVPVLRYFDSDNRISVDITIATNDVSVFTSRFLRKHVMEGDGYVWLLVMFIKLWAYNRGISFSPRGFIGSLGWTTMTLFYIQQRIPSLCPYFQVETINKDDNHKNENKTLHHVHNVIIHRIPWNTAKCSSPFSSSLPCHQTFSSVVSGFFQYYLDFDFDQHVISITSPYVQAREQIDRMTSRPLYIEHPGERAVNITANVDDECLRITRAEMRRAQHAVIATGNADYVCMRTQGNRRRLR